MQSGTSAVPKAKDDDGPEWLKALGIDRTCRLVGMLQGMVVLTRAMDSDEHTLWLFDFPQATGDRRTIRNLYADYLKGDWLEKFYREP